MLFKKYKDAVVKIDIYQAGVLLGYGAGFFISKDGVIATNYHVMSPGLQGGFSVEIKTADGQTIKDFEVGSCSDDRKIDLCLVRVKIKPKSWLEPKQIEYNVGQSIYSIGHPKGYDYSMTDGLISGVRRIESGKVMSDDDVMSAVANAGNEIEQVQISAPISPGNSGGPIFNAKGQLVGVASWFRGDQGSHNLNFAISAGELEQFSKKSTKYTEVKLFKEQSAKDRIARADKISSQEIDPLIEALKQVQANGKWTQPLDSKVWKKATFKAFGDDYQTILPVSLANNCHLMGATPTAIQYRCYAIPMTDGGVQLSFLRRTGKSLAKTMQGKVADPIPLEFTMELMKAGKWPAISKKLSAAQKKMFFSTQVKPTKCWAVNKSAMPFQQDSVHCQMSLINIGEANSAADFEYIDSPKSSTVINITSLCNDFAMAKVFFGYGQVAMMFLKEKPRTPAAPSDGPAIRAPASSSK